MNPYYNYFRLEVEGDSAVGVLMDTLFGDHQRFQVILRQDMFHLHLETLTAYFRHKLYVMEPHEIAGPGSHTLRDMIMGLEALAADMTDSGAPWPNSDSAYKRIWDYGGSATYGLFRITKLEDPAWSA